MDAASSLSPSGFMRSGIHFQLRFKKKGVSRHLLCFRYLSMSQKEGDPVIQAVLSGRTVGAGWVWVLSAGVHHLQCWGLWQSLQHLTCPQVPPRGPSLTFTLIQDFSLCHQSLCLSFVRIKWGHQGLVPSLGHSQISPGPMSTIPCFLFAVFTAYISRCLIKILNSEFRNILERKSSLYGHITEIFFLRNTEETKAKNCPQSSK